MRAGGHKSFSRSRKIEIYIHSDSTESFTACFSLSFASLCVFPPGKMSSKANIGSSSSSALAGLDPLRDLLGDIVGRLETLEAKVGVTPTGAAAAAVTATVPSAKSFKGGKRICVYRERPKMCCRKS